MEAEERTIKLALKHDERPRTEIGSGIAFEKKMNRYVKLGVRDFIVGYEVAILYEWLREHGAIARLILESND